MIKLTAQAVTKRYGNKTALFPLDLKVETGECLAVLGANGAGKTTLLKLLSRQIRPDKGDIFWNEAPVEADAESYRRSIGVISHKSFLYSALSGLENLLYYSSLYGIKNPHERAVSILKRLEMERAMNEPVSSYSRGMLQRVSIARALITDPKVIFLDEPYTGLDIYGETLLTALLRQEREKGAALVLVTHDISLSVSLASRVLVLKGGREVYQGKPKAAETLGELL